MNKRLNRTVRRNPFPMWTLKMVLTEARMDTPPRDLNPHRDVGEELASKLIERMKTRYDKPLPFSAWKGGWDRSALRFEELVESNA
jgi:hypothetical protein